LIPWAQNIKKQVVRHKHLYKTNATLTILL